MSDQADIPVRNAVKYNPHLWAEEDLRSVFVVRVRELEKIVSRIRDIQPQGVPQHLLITGHRGMGKSTLLRRVGLAVKDDPELSKNWIVLSFPEEQYTVSTLSEFWSNVLDVLVDTLEREGADQGELMRLDAKAGKIQSLAQNEREEALLAFLNEWIERNHRRLLLLVDSTDLLFSNLGAAEKEAGKRKMADAGATALWRLRKTLSHHTGIFWVGASYQSLEVEHQYSDAFHDFFELIELRPLSTQDMREAMLAMARTFGAGTIPQGEPAVNKMAEILDGHPERLKALRAITGGNPRTTVMLYDLVASGWSSDLQSDLKALLDLMTPLYKARMENLAEQPRKLLAHLMEYWAPISSGDLAKISNIPATTVSGQLSRLEADGLVEKAKLAGTRRSGYQVAERFFNIWYLMRYTPRRVRQKLAWLVEFMRLWYSAQELKTFAAARALEHAAGRFGTLDHLEQSLAIASALGDDSREHRLLEFSVFATANKLASNLHLSLAEAFPGLFDMDGEDKPFHSAEDYLNRYNALEEELSKCQHIPAEERREWIEGVRGWLLLGLEHKVNISNAAEAFSPDDVEELRGVTLREKQSAQEILGECTDKLRKFVLKGDFFPDCPDAELAYRQILASFGDDSNALRCGAQLMEIHGHHDKWVEKIYRKAIELDPGNALAWQRLGYLLNDFKRYGEAEEAYQMAIKIDPENARSWFGLGALLHLKLARFEEAGKAYRRAVELDPGTAYYWVSLAVLLHTALFRLGDAEFAYKKAIELDSEMGFTWFGFGALLKEYPERYVEAESAYKKAIELDPNELLPVAALARLYVAQKNMEAANNTYRQIIALDVAKKKGDDIDFQGLRLQANLWLKNLDEAKHVLEQLAGIAADGDASAIREIKHQTKQCHSIGLGMALAQLIENSDYADFLLPFSLALKAANGESDALNGVPPEVAAMAQEVLEDLTSGSKAVM